MRCYPRRVGRRFATVLVCASAWVVPPAALASDFWEEVRSPGARAFRAEVTRGETALKDKRWREALTAGERASELRAERCEGPWIRGRAHAGMDDVEAAVEHFRAALAREGRCLDAPEHGARAAVVAAAAGATDLAAQVLGRVLSTMEESPRRRALYALYGDVLLTLGPERLADATRAYREVLRRHADMRATLGLALALRRADRPDEAAELALAAAVYGRVDALVARLPVPEAERAARRAVALEALGDTAGAQEAWRAATEGRVWRSHAEAELQHLGAGRKAHP